MNNAACDNLYKKSVDTCVYKSILTCFIITLAKGMMLTVPASDSLSTDFAGRVDSVLTAAQTVEKVERNQAGGLTAVDMSEAVAIADRRSRAEGPAAAPMIVDDDPNTVWSTPLSSDRPVNISIRLVDSIVLGRIELLTSSDDRGRLRLTSMEVYSATDDEEWAKIGNISDNRNERIYIDTNPVKMRDLRLRILDNDAGWTRVHKVRLYAYSVEGESIGGLVGGNFREVNNSYAICSVTGDRYVGGLAGFNNFFYPGGLHNSYAAGTVSGENYLGGLTGYNNGILGTNYWDIEKSGQEQAAGGGEQGDATGLTTAEMTGVTAEQSMSALAFNDVWGASPNAYPKLAWEFVKPVFLQAPEHEATDIDIRPDFFWEDKPDADTYHLQLSSKNDFSDLIVDSTGITDSPFSMIGHLDDRQTYWWRVRGIKDGYPGAWSDPWSFKTHEPTSIEKQGIPEAFALEQNYPNPFNAKTIISFAISEPAHVDLSVYNLLGERIFTLVHEHRSPGRHEIVFDAEKLSSGLFIYRLQAGDYTRTRKMLLIK